MFVWHASAGFGGTYVRAFYLGLLAGSPTPPLFCRLLLLRWDGPLVAHVGFILFPSLRPGGKEKSSQSDWMHNTASSSLTHTQSRGGREGRKKKRKILQQLNSLTATNRRWPAFNRAPVVRLAQLIRIYFHGLFLSRVRSITQTYGVSQIWDRRETGSHHSAAARAGYEAVRPGFKKNPPNSLPSPPNPSVVFPRASSRVQPPGVAHEAGLCAELSHGALSRSMHAGAVHTHRSTHNTQTQ